MMTPMKAISDSKRKNLYIVVPITITVVLFIIHIFLVILPIYRQNLYESKKETLEELVLMVISLLENSQMKVENGELDLEEAQQNIIDQIKDIRYGLEAKDYFWITDKHTKMIMHPYLPELLGNDLRNVTDAVGTKVFAESVEVVKRNGEGYIEYYWQWKDNPEKIEHKLSFVKEFKPWGWIIGSGIYLEDVHAEIDLISKKVTLISIFILAVVFVLSVLIIRNNVEAENRRIIAEQSLRHSEERFRALAELMPEIIFEMDRDGSLLFCNKGLTEKTGYEFDELKDSFNSFKIFTHDNAEEIKFNTIRAMNGEDVPERIDYDIIRKDGSMFKAIIRSSPIIQDGKCIGVRGILIDITDRLRLEQENEIQFRHLAQADKMASLGVLVSGVAHEINNPNNYIMLNGKMLLRVWDDTVPILQAYFDENGDFPLAGIPYSRAKEKIRQLIQGIPEGAERIQKIVGSLKDFARQDPGKMAKDVDMNKVVDSAVTIVSNLIKKTTNHFSMNLTDNIPLIEGNYQQLEQVLINLLTNACQSLPDTTKKLDIETVYDSSREVVMCIVKDEGSGISEDARPHIMDPFFTTKRESDGTGLGLSISYTFIREHNGTINIESEENSGTTATITLPIPKGDINA